MQLFRMYFVKMENLEVIHSLDFCYITFIPDIKHSRYSKNEA